MFEAVGSLSYAHHTNGLVIRAGDLKANNKFDNKPDPASSYAGCPVCYYKAEAARNRVKGYSPFNYPVLNDQGKIERDKLIGMFVPQALVFFILQCQSKMSAISVLNCNLQYCFVLRKRQHK